MARPEIAEASVCWHCPSHSRSAGWMACSWSVARLNLVRPAGDWCRQMCLNLSVACPLRPGDWAAWEPLECS